MLNSQELMGEELEMFARKETQKDVIVPKKVGEALGIVVVESGEFVEQSKFTKLNIKPLLVKFRSCM